MKWHSRPTEWAYPHRLYVDGTPKVLLAPGGEYWYEGNYSRLPDELTTLDEMKKYLEVLVRMES